MFLAKFYQILRNGSKCVVLVLVFFSYFFPDLYKWKGKAVRNPIRNIEETS